METLIVIGIILAILFVASYIKLWWDFVNIKIDIEVLNDWKILRIKENIEDIEKDVRNIKRAIGTLAPEYTIAKRLDSLLDYLKLESHFQSGLITKKKEKKNG